MPNKEQLEAMGPEAAKESLRAQREARGLAPHVGQSTTTMTTTTDYYSCCRSHSFRCSLNRFYNRGQTVANDGRTATCTGGEQRTDGGERTNDGRTADGGGRTAADGGKRTTVGRRRVFFEPRVHFPSGSLPTVESATDAGCDTAGSGVAGNGKNSVGADGGFVYWTPGFLGDDTLSAEEWEKRACKDSYAGTKRFGNHKCRKNICLKRKGGKKYKRQQCRFRYWHFEKVLSKTKEPRMRRVPGRQLATVWDGQGLPPVHAHPPEIGLPALECTWPYHFKASFGTLLGARCNHDVGVLGRLPVLTKDIEGQLLGDKPFTELPPEVRGELLRELASGIVDREYYASEYGSKEDERSIGLFEAFHDATLRYKERYAKVAPTEHLDLSEDQRLLLRCKRLMQSLTAQLHKGHHVGLPAVMSYIRGMPICYSSHSFEPLHTDKIWSCVYDVLRVCSGVAEPAKSADKGYASYPPTMKPTASKVLDYDWRPDALEMCPYYFFVAGTDVVKSGVSKHSRLLARAARCCWESGRQTSLFYDSCSR